MALCVVPAREEEGAPSLGSQALGRPAIEDRGTASQPCLSQGYPTLHRPVMEEGGSASPPWLPRTWTWEGWLGKRGYNFPSVTGPVETWISGYRTAIEASTAWLHRVWLGAGVPVVEEGAQLLWSGSPVPGLYQEGQLWQGHSFLGMAPQGLSSPVVVSCGKGEGSASPNWLPRD